MALHVMNVLKSARVLRWQLPCGPVWVPSASFFYRIKDRSLSKKEDLPESADVHLYQNDLSETVLRNRERHLPERGQQSPFKDKKIKCVLCAYNIEPDYKNVRLLSQFVSGFSGVIYDKHITGLCQKRQNQIIKEVLKSRTAGLMPFTYKVNKYQKDPQLFNPARPRRPHPYF